MTDELTEQLAQIRPDTYAEGWAASPAGRQTLLAIHAAASAQPRRLLSVRLSSLGRVWRLRQN